MDSRCPYRWPVPFRPVQVGVLSAFSLIFSSSLPAYAQICISTNSRVTKGVHLFTCFLTSLRHLAPVLRHLPLNVPYLGYKRRVNFRCGKGKVIQLEIKDKKNAEWSPGHRSILSKPASYIHL